MFKQVLMISMIGLSLFSTMPLYAWNTQAPSSSVIIFVSFSMPKESLRGWIKEAEKIKAPIVIRGLVNNSFAETTKTVMSILPENRGGVQLDPTLFKRFHIDKVPAVVVIDPACLSKESCNAYDVIYGNVPLSYALTKIIQQKNQLSPYAKVALQKLNESV